ncbi:hypothetical protein ASPU41_20820 (plasmid) [Arthrobacter sp. U41]|nr:hypothetical protein ASPU41_20155 [Arthrobacter sp. U41]AOT05897.1 hypothetical protein ASPU41_20820 [Arthrobacter sp. U41]
MSESENNGPAPPATDGGGRNDRAPASREHQAAPPTQGMRTVGQRRRDAEQKLEEHQQEARHKTEAEDGSEEPSASQ